MIQFEAMQIFSVGVLGLFFWINPAWSDLPAGAVPAGSPVSPAGSSGFGQSQGGIMAFAPFLLMFAIFYFLVIRPQQKKVKEQQEMIQGLKQGDEVVTQSGMIGKITGMTEKVLTLEVADQVRVKMLRSQVSQVVKGTIKELASS